MANPAAATDPVAQQLLMKGLELSGAGISPVSIASAIGEKTKKDIETLQQNVMMQPTETTAVKMGLTAKPMQNA